MKSSMRRKPKPDTRPRWNDDLKVYFSGKWYEAEEYRKLCERYLKYNNMSEPHFSKDPTYNLRKKKCPTTLKPKPMKQPID